MDFPECDQLKGRLRSICRGEILAPADCDVYRVKLWGFSRRFSEDNATAPPADQQSRKKPPCGKTRGPGYGPGTELLKTYAAAGVPSCQACKELAGRMDIWGSSGCRERIDRIVDEIMPRAKKWVKENHPWVHALLPNIVEETGIRVRIRHDVMVAIERAETPK